MFVDPYNYSRPQAHAAPGIPGAVLQVNMEFEVATKLAIFLGNATFISLHLVDCPVPRYGIISKKRAHSILRDHIRSVQQSTSSSDSNITKDIQQLRIKSLKLARTLIRPFETQTVLIPEWDLVRLMVPDDQTFTKDALDLTTEYIAWLTKSC